MAITAIGPTARSGSCQRELRETRLVDGAAVVGHAPLAEGSPRRSRLGRVVLCVCGSGLICTITMDVRREDLERGDHLGL